MAEAALPPAPAFPPLDNSIGAFLVGTILTVFLAGITSVQSYSYFAWFGRTDRKLLVGVVAFLMAVDLFHTAISCYTIYLWTVTHYGDIAFLINCPWSFTWDPFLTGLVAIIVQAFYAWRVFVVSHRKWYIPAAIGVLSLLQFAFAIGSTWMIYRLDDKFARFGEFRYGVAIWLLSAAVADILITGSLIMYLRKATKDDYQTSSPIVERILRITIETNGLTCIFAIIDAILFVAMPQDSWHVLPNLSLVKLYFNGLLVSLNSRKALQTQSARGDGNNNGTPVDTPAPRYTATFGSVPSPHHAAQHQLATLSISPAHAEEAKCEGDAEKAGEPSQPQQLHVQAYDAPIASAATVSVPAGAVAVPMHGAARPGTAKSREEAISSGAVRSDW